jgi:hypothetical protein
MSQLPLKHKNFIICLFNRQYGRIQSIIVLFEQIKSGDFRDKSGKISENNPPILIGTHIFILNQLHKNI